jgi:hypothetical protein
MKSARLFIAFFLAILFLSLECVFPASAREETQPPNIVYIMADDLGRKDVGFHGSDIQTPNIDKLAKDGVILEQFYAQPMCTPTRAALMTGRYPHRYGLQTAVIPSAGKYGLSTDEWLLPQALKEAGYTTAIVGKWHLGHADRKYWPLQRGFDYQYGPILGEIDYYDHSAHGTIDWYRNNQLVKEKGYVTTLLGQDAVRLMRSMIRRSLCFYTWLSPRPMPPIKRPRSISTSIRTLPIPHAAPTLR